MTHYTDTDLDIAIRQLRSAQRRRYREGWHPSEGERLADQALDIACSLLHRPETGKG